MSSLTSELRKSLAGAVELAIARQQAGDLVGAEALYLKVLGVDEANAVALHNLGLIRLHGGNTPVALELLSAAVQQLPKEPVFRFNLALALQQAGRLAEAQDEYRQVVRLNPGYRAAWENLGVVQQDLDRYADAEMSYRKALALEPCSAIAHRNLVVLLRADGRLEEALRQCDLALECEPMNASIAVQKGVMLLSQGDYAGGWPLNEWRYWNTEALDNSPPCRVALPKWDGSSLEGRHILACGEQGIGDEIMYASCIPDLARQAQAVTVACAERLVPLFTRSFPNTAVRAVKDAMVVLQPHDDFDTHISLPSLPRYLRTDAQAFDGRPYLQADRAAVACWRDRLAALGDKPKIGVSWRGGQGDTKVRAARSLELNQLQPLFERDDVVFVDVQYGEHAEELARFGAAGGRPPVAFAEIDPLRDMDDFAALLSALDLVISVDNSTVHLAGALGVPTWVLLPPAADWRWGLSGERSVWYDSVWIWRRGGQGAATWPELIEQVGAQLDSGVPSKAQLPTLPEATTAVVPGSGDAAPRAILLNDTSYWYHWGCTCTSLALHDGLRGAGYAVEGVPITAVNRLVGLPGSIEEFDSEPLFSAFCAVYPQLIEQLRRGDLIVVNGEGSLHGLGQTALALLYLMYVSWHWLGKRTQVVNHSGYPAEAGSPAEATANTVYQKVYAGLERVVVREPASVAVLARLGIAAEEGFDSLPLFASRRMPAVVHNGRRIVLAGTVALSEEYLALVCGLAEHALALGYGVDVLVGANAYVAGDDLAFVNALQRRLQGRYRLVAATSEAEWLQAIGSAQLLVSGRFHHTIAAAWLGTPFLVSASNTSKIDGLLQRLEIEPDTVWISPAQPQQARQRFDALLGEPARGRLTPAVRERLLQMAATNLPVSA